VEGESSARIVQECGERGARGGGMCPHWTASFTPLFCPVLSVNAVAECGGSEREESRR